MRHGLNFRQKCVELVERPAEALLHRGEHAFKHRAFLVGRIDRSAAQIERGASAYTAYRQAFAYDQTNELAKVKMERIIDQQKALATGATPANFDPRTGNAIANPDGVEISTKPPRSQDLNQNITWRETGFKTLVTGLAGHLGLNVVMDETVKDT